MDLIVAQVAEDERQKELQRQADNSRRGGGGGGRMPLGRGDARQFSGGPNFGAPPPDFQSKVGADDLRRLGSRANTRQVSSQGQPTFGPTSMFNSNRGSNTRKPLALAQKDDSGSSSRVGTPPAQKEKDKKDELEAKKNTNAFSALADEATEPEKSPAPSPALTKAQPAVDRSNSKSPLGKDVEQADSKSSET